MILRCTAKGLRLLDPQDLITATPGGSDWYLNLVWSNRRKCLLLVHAGTLFPVFIYDVRVADLCPIGPYIAGQIAEALQDEGLPPDRFGDLSSESLLLPRTADRRILGVMNDMARAISYEAARSPDWTRGRPPAVNHFLRRGLHRRGADFVSPLDLVAPGEKADQEHEERRSGLERQRGAPGDTD